MVTGEHVATEPEFRTHSAGLPRVLVDGLLGLPGRFGCVGGELGIPAACFRNSGKSFSTIPNLPDFLPPLDRVGPLGRGQLGAAQVLVDLEQILIQAITAKVLWSAPRARGRTVPRSRPGLRRGRRGGWTS